MANRELEIQLTYAAGTSTPQEDRTLRVAWLEQTAMFVAERLDGSFPTAEHLVDAIESSGRVLAPASYDRLFTLDQEVTRIGGDALVVADSTLGAVGLVTPRGQVTAITRLRPDGYLPAHELAAMVAPATFTARSVDRQVDIDVVGAEFGTVIDAHVTATALRARDMQVWAIAKLGGDSPMADQALDLACQVTPASVARATRAIDAHLQGPHRASPGHNRQSRMERAGGGSRPTLRSHHAVDVHQSLTA